ncbi:uncharacterized protein LOC129786625 [Lutzomyia longipalpis]|uniref:uncharacterized protein LOC129786625 n=1 Tax=Lutzomyia longipalpis TaxID=7200 RepID=UPI0024840975|nr:uncharacterized protein LOC129786625 [Lutzomyia longipalpis]
MRRKSEIHKHFEASADKVRCIYCNYVIIKNATRMTEHLQKCMQCPEGVRRAEFLNRPLKKEIIKVDEPGPDFSEINDWTVFSNDESEEIRTMTPPPGKRHKSEDGGSQTNPFIEMEETHVDYFFKSMALQVKTANLTQQNFIDLQIAFLNLFSTKIREYKH